MKSMVLTISDVVIGYGSPQIVALTNSICKLLKRNGVICQPLVPKKPFVDFDNELLSLETIYTKNHPYSVPGWLEYIHNCALLINKYKPSILIITNYNFMVLLDKLIYTPQKIIHLALEDLDYFFLHDQLRTMDLILNKISTKIDIWIFPEVNRARYDASKLGIDPSRINIFYNVNTGSQNDPKVTNKIPRMVHAGTLDDATSIGHIIFDLDFAEFPIDVFGELGGDLESKNMMLGKIEALRNANSNIEWHGQIKNSELSKKLSSYMYSLVYWRPQRHALLNAAPNKFFQAVAAGVPVISAPHPQPKMLIERYGCGLVLDGWDKERWISGLQKALRLFETPSYEEMQKNCLHAVEIELAWDTQFDRFSRKFGLVDWNN